MMAGNHDSVLVPEGYHPVVSAHGYTSYYLNFPGGQRAVAGEQRRSGVFVGARDVDVQGSKRLPIVHHGMDG